VSSKSLTLPEELGSNETMFASFFESIKYVGHLVPIAFLRIFIGYYYLHLALEKFRGDFLSRPRFSAAVAEMLPSLNIPTWYKHFLEAQVIPHWQTTAFVIVGLEFALAFAYILGYVTRPMALLGLFYSLNLLMLSDPSLAALYKTFIAIHFVMAWVGAGRCLGLDYYFFKRRRGIWW
jgi:thiosulfate dehydrogenase [quinone] large subunit